MALAGTWKAQASVDYAGAQRWGTGINAVHGIASEIPRGGLNGEADVPPTLVPPEITTDHPSNSVYGYCDEDSASALWGYGFATGTADRPSWGADEERASTGEFPPYAPPPGPKGTPSGSTIRRVRRGSQATTASKTGAAMPDAQQGLLQKANFGIVEDSVVSDRSQYEMQTSMTQRDKVREGSQRNGGSASEFDAPIQSQRITWFQRAFKPSGGDRHYDMFPRQQDTIMRGFQYRTAGVGPARNSPMPEGMFVTTPRQRVAPDNPDQGADVVSTTVGYMPEDDQGWYLV